MSVLTHISYNFWINDTRIPFKGAVLAMPGSPNPFIVTSTPRWTAEKLSFTVKPVRVGTLDIHQMQVYPPRPPEFRGSHAQFNWTVTEGSRDTFKIEIPTKTLQSPEVCGINMIDGLTVRPDTVHKVFPKWNLKFRQPYRFYILSLFRSVRNTLNRELPYLERLLNVEGLVNRTIFDMSVPHGVDICPFIHHCMLNWFVGLAKRRDRWFGQSNAQARKLFRTCRVGFVHNVRYCVRHNTPACSVPVAEMGVCFGRFRVSPTTELWKLFNILKFTVITSNIDNCYIYQPSPGEIPPLPYPRPFPITRENIHNMASNGVPIGSSLINTQHYSISTAPRTINPFDVESASPSIEFENYVFVNQAAMAVYCTAAEELFSNVEPSTAFYTPSVDMASIIQARLTIFRNQRVTPRNVDMSFNSFTLLDHGRRLPIMRGLMTVEDFRTRRSFFIEKDMSELQQTIRKELESMHQDSPMDSVYQSATVEYGTNIIEHYRDVYCNADVSFPALPLSLPGEKVYARTPTFGVEVELELNEEELNLDALNDLSRYLTGKYKELICIRDSSIEFGFEIVTLPMTYRKACDFWKKISEDPILDECRVSDQPDTVGTHIHVGRRAFTPVHLGKLISIMFDHEDCERLARIVGRDYYSNGYCGIEDCDPEMAKVSTVLNPSEFDKYQPLNLCKRPTVEFRVFSSPQNLLDVTKYLTTVQRLIDFTRESSIRDCNINKFLDYYYKLENQRKKHRPRSKKYGG
jgi:hypothetical protein